MAGEKVVDHNRHTDFFCSRIQLNIDYWRDFLLTAEDTNAVAQEFPRIIRAISFGLEQPKVWSATYKLLIESASVAEKSGIIEQWIALLNHAVDAAQTLEDMPAQINITAVLGRFTQLQSRFKQSINYYRRMLMLARQETDRYSEARALTNLGYTYIEQGHWWRAEVLCHFALSIFQQLNNQHGQAHTQNHLGILYTRKHSWTDAKRHLEQACDIWRTTADKEGLLYGTINLGLLYNEMISPEDALPYLFDALELTKEQNTNSLTSTIYTNLGIAYRLLGKPETAFSYAKKAEAECRKSTNLSGIALALDNMGLACIDLQRWADAQQYLTNALELWRQLQNNHNIVRTELYFLELELAQNHNSKASERLASLECLNQQSNWFSQYSVLYQEFTMYRNRLRQLRRQ